MNIAALGIVALFFGLTAGGWIGFLAEGGSTDSLSDALKVSGIFVALSPFVLLSPFTIWKATYVGAHQIIMVLLVIIGGIFITFSWVRSHRTGVMRLQLGTLVGALVYNTAAGMALAQAFSA